VKAYLGRILSEPLLQQPDIGFTHRERTLTSSATGGKQH